LPLRLFQLVFRNIFFERDCTVVGGGKYLPAGHDTNLRIEAFFSEKCCS
jgi:hypothetical protein